MVTQRPSQKCSMLDSDTLIVRHLPEELSDADTADLLEHFGAVHVRCPKRAWRQGHTAIARFMSRQDAQHALCRLHQLQVLGCTLSVEFITGQEAHQLQVSDSSPSHGNISMKDSKFYERFKRNYQKFQVHLNGLAPKLNLEMPLSPSLKYQYPPPSPSILTNITHALAAVPRFYTQVLHLMNKMNLPSPFGPVSAAPPLHPDSSLLAMNGILAGGAEELTDTFPGNGKPDDSAEEPVEMEVGEDSSTEESELESEGEPVQKIEDYVPVKRLRKSEKETIKRPKLIKHAIKRGIEHATKPVQIPIQPSEVFEPVEAVRTKKTEVKIRPVEMKSVKVTRVEECAPVEGGFGTFAPTVDSQPATVEGLRKEEQLWEDSDFITSKELKENRIKEEDMKILPVYKNYVSGTPSARLYIKNLAKQVQAKDLRYIYGRYVLWTSEEEQNMFDARLMTEGRMKGQAFITLPSLRKAQEALAETNGYILRGKPMVVQFARSAKPKITEQAEVTDSTEN